MLLSHMIANEVGHRNICSAIGVPTSASAGFSR